MTEEKRTALRPRHVLGVDLGTSNLRVYHAAYDASGRPQGEPRLVDLPNNAPGGAVPTVLQIGNSPDGPHLLDYGWSALQNLEQEAGQGFVWEFKPCIGRAEEDLAAQGRPERLKSCPNPACRATWASQM